ncbi:hypothetical protein BDZ45DRAFT_696716 [Acephala macrosclerotiorum]|nr:hypothetical protein BDZ45DRAFT_696716 [Acephala macrosclerotiorum]
MEIRGWENGHDRSKRLDLKELTALLLPLSGSFLQTSIAANALDESMEDAHIKLLITSRSHPPDIRRAFNRKPQLNIVATEKDIREYLASKLDDDYELAGFIGPDLRDNILSNKQYVRHVFTRFSTYRELP